jgi:hypothetical protein
MSRQNIFWVSWFVTTLGAGWFVLQGPQASISPLAITVVVALAIYTTAALLWWLPKPALDDPSDPTRTRKGLFAISTIVIAAILFSVYLFAGYYLLFALPVLGLVVLVLLRRYVARRELLYALGLGLIAGIAGLAAGINLISPSVWAILQVSLVVTGLPAGWSMLRHSRLLQAGVGHSRFLTEGIISVLSGFAQGIALCIPWALSAVVLGTNKGETWVQAWWQPVTAIQPGIAEEAWGRMLLVPLVFLILHRVARTQVALTAALIIVGYWFAYLHTPGGFDLVTTLMVGTLMVLPISYLCFYRDVETAIGFHFGYDFITSAAIFLLTRGLGNR